MNCKKELNQTYNFEANTKKSAVNTVTEIIDPFNRTQFAVVRASCFFLLNAADIEGSKFVSVCQQLLFLINIFGNPIIIKKISYEIF